MAQRIPVRFWLLLVGLTLLLPERARGGANAWTTNFPVGRTVFDIVLDPGNASTVYAASEGGGVLKSGDGGATWSPTGLGGSVSSLAIASTTPPTLYAVPFSGGLLKSTDGGMTWRPADVGLPGASKVVIPPAMPTTAYAIGRSGVFRSMNSGDSWVQLTNPLAGRPEGPTSLAVDPRASSTLYLGTSGGATGIFRSTDGGATWNPINEGLAFSGVAGLPGITVLAVDPSNTQTVYAGSQFGILKSINGGQSWFSSDAGLQRHAILDLVVDSGNPGTIYAATFNCVIPTSMSALPLVAPAAHTPGGDGVYRSIDSGASWTPFNNGLTHRCVYSVAASPDGKTLHAATFFRGVFSYTLAPPCIPTSNQLCLLDGRFRVTLEATDPRAGNTGIGHAIPQGNRHGSFSLPSFTGDPTFPEVIVKMLDATGVPPPLGGFFWVFHTGLTDLQYTMTVTDMMTGALRTYRNNRSDPANLCGGADTVAFRN